MKQKLRNRSWHMGVLAWACGILFMLPLCAQEGPEAGTAQAGPDAALVSAGEALFKGNCTVCHTINERVVGPALRDIHKRQEISWIKRFVKNSQKVIASGDAYAVALYNEYNQTEMTAFDFSDQELDALIAYIVSESAKPAETTASVAETTAGGEATGVAVSDWELKLLWVVVLLVLLLVFLMLTVFATYLRNQSLKGEALSEEARTSLTPTKGKLSKTLGGTTFLSFAVFFFAAIATKSTLDGLYGIGVQQGYAPKQPIAFSHKIHAGQYEIDCAYCHTGVRISKSANIPSANICLNCHNEIKRESPEIEKIHSAVEQNRPIEWVRVHNLPDLSYFNHAQHVAVGGIACETCHGEVKEMEVVAQHAELTMGWCINCHRETEVATQGNAYYDKLIKIHDSKTPIRVEDIGGLECSKCHY